MKTCKGCKHYKKDEITRLIVCEFGLHESYCEKDKEDFAIEELEQIKNEIQGLIDFEESCCGNTTLGYECLGVIDNHISELKEIEE